MYVCVCVGVFGCVCVCVWMCVRVFVSGCVFGYLVVPVPEAVLFFACLCVCECVHFCMCVYMHACVCACTCPIKCVCHQEGWGWVMLAHWHWCCESQIRSLLFKMTERDSSAVCVLVFVTYNIFYQCINCQFMTRNHQRYCP